ncbi:MAG: polysaccharide lyase, partial [Candidatus Dormibacteria bacterium]
MMPSRITLSPRVVAIVFLAGLLAGVVLVASLRPTGTSKGSPPPQAAASAPPEATAPAIASNPTGATTGEGSSTDVQAFLGSDFSGKSFCKFKHQNVSISGDTLTVSYPAGSSAPSAGKPYGGAQLCRALASGSTSDATLSYDIRFPVGFQFVQGGKLPGVYGGVEPFSGGGHNASGWSMRLMWRPNGAAEVYGYVSTSSGYGDSWGRGNFH